MQRMRQKMYRKELGYCFSTPIAYIAIGLYLTGISLFLWVIPGEWNIPQGGYAGAEGLFHLSPWLLMVLCPALTMRLFAEERQNGTWGLLLTKPISLTRAVTEKAAAVWTVTVLAQTPCIVHYFLVASLAEPIGNTDTGAFFGSFIGLLLLSAAFCAIGTWSSTLTESQITAFVVGLTACFLLYWGLDLAASLFTDGRAANFTEQLGLHAHYASLSRGVIDLRDTVYFGSVTAVFVLLSVYGLSRQRNE